MRRWDPRITAVGLACTAILLAATPVFAQGRTSGNSSSSGNSFGSSSSSGNSFGSSGGSMSSFGTSGSGLSFGTSGSGLSLGGSGSNSFTGGTGGTSGNTFTGGTGGNAFTGATGGTGRTGATTSTQVGVNSFLGTTYANPLAMGLSGASTTTTANLGAPVYTVTTSRTTTSTASTSTQNNQFGAGVGIRRLPAYATRIAIRDMPPPPTAAQVRADLQGMFAQSSQLDLGDTVRVLIDGQAVVLQGQVVDDDERSLVENMVRLTPGVYQIRNELTTRRQ